MCNPAAFIVTKNSVLFSKTSDSHEEILKENNLRYGSRVNFVRVEISPPDNDFNIPFDKWIFKTDQDMLPDWYCEEDAEEATRCKLKAWAKHHLVTYEGIVFGDETRSITCYDGNLDLRGTPVTSLGDLQSVGGDLDLRGTQVTSLGDLQSVGGDLYLRGTPVTSLGDLQFVDGSLDLRGTQVTSFGALQSVGGYLDLRGTQVTKKDVPENLIGKAVF
jgi:hypothetical protein